MKKIIPKPKAQSEPRIAEKNTLKMVDYELPPVNRKVTRAK